MKKILFSILFVLACCTSFAFSSAPLAGQNTCKVDTVQWTAGPALDGIKAYYRIDSCGSLPVVFLKFINTNNYNVSITWDDQLSFLNEPALRQIKSEKSTLVVSPGEIAGTECDKPAIPVLLIKPVDSPIVPIVGFVFSNLTVSKN